MYNLIIIGGGPAGLSSAIYAARANLHPLLIHEDGGQLTITTDVENYPGFLNIQGPELIENMTQQAKEVGTTFINDTVEKVDLSQQPFTVTTMNGDTFTCKSIIIATGSQSKWLGIEDQFRGKGVSSCATCDGFFYKQKTVIVVGGGNTAVEEALYLTQHASNVILVHRRDTLRAENILQQRLFQKKNVDIRWNTVVNSICGNDQGVYGVETNHGFIECQGVFIAIGHTPNTKLFKDQLELTPNGYIQTNHTRTSIKGVFAAGDVQDEQYRQAITSAGSGCIAAIEAMNYLQTL